MPRKKTIEQLQFAETVEHRRSANGAMRPTKYMQRTSRRKDAGTAIPLKVIRIDASLYDIIVSQKGDMSITQYANQLIRKGMTL